VIRETFQDLNRLRQIAMIAGRHGFGELLERGGLWRILGRKEQVEVSPESRRASTAHRFRLLLNELGPTFIKLGQILSTRADLLPAEFIEELSILQDHVPPFPLVELRAQVESSLGKPVAELFAQIEPEPLAAASIAQVHRAATLAGEAVVVKVQRPGIFEQIRADLSVLHYMARILEALVEETGIYKPTGIVEEFERAIFEELDFLNEASNVKAFFRTHEERAYLRIPRVYDELSSPTVLTLEYLPGVKISQVDLSKHDRTQLSRILVESAFRQIFEDGLFHGDPHPGNLLVMENDVLALLDFGVVGRITPQMQQTLVMLVLAVALKDPDSVARIIYRVGIPDARANLSGFRADIEMLLSEYLPTSLGKVDTPALLRQLLDLAVKYRIRIPKEYALLSRAAITLEGILRTLHPELNVMEIGLPYAKELLLGKYDPSQLQGGLLRTLFRLQGFASDLPVQLSQILMDLESGKFAINIRAEQLGQMNKSLRSAALMVFLGFCASGFIVGTFIAFAQLSVTWRGLPVMGVLGLTGTVLLVGVALGWYVMAGGPSKLSVRRWVGKKKRR